MGGNLDDFFDTSSHFPGSQAVSAPPRYQGPQHHQHQDRSPTFPSMYLLSGYVPLTPLQPGTLQFSVVPRYTMHHPQSSKHVVCKVLLYLEVNVCTESHFHYYSESNKNPFYSLFDRHPCFLTLLYHSRVVAFFCSFLPSLLFSPSRLSTKLSLTQQYRDI